MPDEDQPKRGRGRPRVNPVGTLRRNVTVQVEAELYEALVGASNASKLSISREIQDRLKASFEPARSAQDIGELIEDARQKAEDEWLVELHGHEGLIWAKGTADIYNRHVRKLVAELGWAADGDMPDGFAEKLLDRVRADMGEVAEIWKTRVLLAQMIAKVKSTDLGPLVGKALEIPEIKEKLEGMFARRQAKSAGAPPEDK